MKKLLFLSAILYTCAASALLAPRPAGSPEAALKDTVDQLLVNLNGHALQYRKDQASFYAMVDEVVVPRFDIGGIAQFALGKHGRKATVEQRQQFAEVLARTLVHSYANLMLERYDSMALVWSPARLLAAGTDLARINSVLAGDGGQRFPVGFLLRRVDGDWKVYDLEIEGVSLALNYRAQLSAEIDRTSLAAVIARMTGQDVGSSSPEPK